MKICAFKGLSFHVYIFGERRITNHHIIKDLEVLTDQNIPFYMLTYKAGNFNHCHTKFANFSESLIFDIVGSVAQF